MVLVTLDGVRWQEIFQGVDASLARGDGLPSSFVAPAERLLPSIRGRLGRHGVVLGEATTMRTSNTANVSLPGYREILTGHVDETCLSNECAPLRVPTLLDEARALENEDDAVAAIGSWDTLAQAVSWDPSSIVVSVGRHAGTTRDRLRVDAAASALLDEAAESSPSPGHGDYRPDRYTSELALRYLESRRPRLLFVSLGDTDEQAHAGAYGRYIAALQAADAFVGRLLDTLATMGEYGATATVVVTTDHGRSHDFVGHGKDAPESSRVWLVAGGAALAEDSPADSATLADVAPTLRELLGLPAGARAANAGGQTEGFLRDSRSLAVRR